MTNGTILLVEDNPEFQKIYGDRLVVDGYEILEAGNGVEGLAMLRSHPVQLVITDLNMPEMDGYAMLAEIQKDPKLSQIPVIVMSVFDAPEKVKQARDLGAADYVVKGASTPKEVSEKVSAVMKRRYGAV